MSEENTSKPKNVLSLVDRQAGDAPKTPVDQEALAKEEVVKALEKVKELGLTSMVVIGFSGDPVNGVVSVVRCGDVSAPSVVYYLERIKLDLLMGHVPTSDNPPG